MRRKSNNTSNRGRGRSQVKGTENFFKKIMEEKFPNLNEAPLKAQEAYRTQNRLVKKINSL